MATPESAANQIRSSGTPRQSLAFLELRNPYFVQYPVIRSMAHGSATNLLLRHAEAIGIRI